MNKSYRNGVGNLLENRLIAIVRLLDFADNNGLRLRYWNTYGHINTHRVAFRNAADLHTNDGVRISHYLGGYGNSWVDAVYRLAVHSSCSQLTMKSGECLAVPRLTWVDRYDSGYPTIHVLAQGALSEARGEPHSFGLH